MNRSHDELREALGAYVLGHLDADDTTPSRMERPTGAPPGRTTSDASDASDASVREVASLRAEVEVHLPTCSECRSLVDELRGVRTALDSMAHEGDPAARVRTPPGLDAAVAAALAAEAERAASEQPPDPTPFRRRRSRRDVALAGLGGLLVGAAAVTTGVLVTRDPAPATPPAPVVVALPALTAADGVVASAGLVDHTWGLELRLRMQGLPAGATYDVRVEDDGGRRFDAGEFLGVGPGTTIVCSMSSSVLAVDARHFEVVDPSGSVVIEGDLPT